MKNHQLGNMFGTFSKHLKQQIQDMFCFYVFDFWGSTTCLTKRCGDRLPSGDFLPKTQGKNQIAESMKKKHRVKHCPNTKMGVIPRFETIYYVIPRAWQFCERDLFGMVSSRDPFQGESNRDLQRSGIQRFTAWITWRRCLVEGLSYDVSCGWDFLWMLVGRDPPPPQKKSGVIKGLLTIGFP